MSSALLLLPDFLLIVLGALLYRFAPFEKSLWAGIEQLVYFVLFPALLFLSTSTANFHGAGTSLFIFTGCSATLAGIALGWLSLLLFRIDRLDFASAMQTGFRFNSYIALAAASRLGGTEGTALMAILLGLNVPLANAAAVHALARHGEGGVWGAMLRNPLIIATLSGLIVNAFGLRLPDALAATLGRLGAASIALGLMAVGAGLRVGGSQGNPAFRVWMLTVKLLILPAVTLGVGLVLGLPHLQLVIAVTFAALPSASSAYILAVRMGGNGALVAWLISVSTAASALTLPLWLLLVTALSLPPPG